MRSGDRIVVVVVVVVVVVCDVMGDVATVCVGTRSRFRISATMDAWPRMARS